MSEGLSMMAIAIPFAYSQEKSRILVDARGTCCAAGHARGLWDRYSLGEQVPDQGPESESLCSGIFSSDLMKCGGAVEQSEEDWRKFRNQREYSHVLRAVLSAIALIALIVARAR